MKHSTYILLFIFAGMVWSGLMLIIVAVMAGLRKLRTPKPTQWEKEWLAIERNLSK